MEGVREYDLLTLEEEKDLSEKILSGDEDAVNRLFLCNLRLTIKLARDYCGHGLPMMDLISEGNMGLMTACRKYNWKKGKFSTYAALWIKQSIRRALSNQSKIIRVPVHTGAKLSKARKKRNEIMLTEGREASAEEIAEKVGIGKARQHLIDTPTTFISLDTNPYDDEDVPHTRYADEKAVNPFDALVKKNLMDDMKRYMRCLTPRERSIIVARYGLNGRKPATLDILGKRHKITRERVRQIQEQALKKLNEVIKR